MQLVHEVSLSEQAAIPSASALIKVQGVSRASVAGDWTWAEE
jgi:hypothetical protein